MTQTDLALGNASNTGQVQYNGFIFPPAVKANVSFTPEYSDDKRTTKYVRADISIEFVLADGMGDTGSFTYDKTALTDTAMLNLRKRLTKPGQHLKFTSQGVGSISINDPTQPNFNRDLDNGPQPKVVSWKPMGGGRACLVTWQCSTCFAECCTSGNISPASPAVAQLVYSVSWGIDRRGFQSRSINGSLEIPQSRRASAFQCEASRYIERSADETWEALLALFPIGKNYHREMNHTLSDDRKTISFTLTDTEIDSPNPFFKGVVEVDASRRMSSSFETGFVKWLCGISGTVEVAPNYSLYRGWLVFALIFNDIFARGTLGKRKKTDNDSPTEPGDAEDDTSSYAILTALEFEEELFGRSFTFSASWMLFCTLGEVLKATGFFSPLNTIPTTEASWTVWKESLAVNRNGRGWRNQKDSLNAFDQTQEVIVDMCLIEGIGPPSASDIEPYPGESLSLSSNATRTEGITAARSWIYYESDYRIEADDGTVVSMPLQRGDPIQETTDLNLTSQSSTPLPRVIPSGSTSSGSASIASPVIHRVRPTRYKLIFTGKALRAGYQISTPNVRSVGGIPVRKIGKDVSTPNKVIAKGMDVTTGRPYTIYGTSWRKEYILDSLPPNGKIVTDGNVAAFA